MIAKIKKYLRDRAEAREVRQEKEDRLWIEWGMAVHASNKALREAEEARLRRLHQAWMELRPEYLHLSFESFRALHSEGLIK